MSSRFSAALAVLVLAAAGSPAEPPKQEPQAEPTPEIATQIVCEVRVLTVRDDLFDRAGVACKPAAALTDAQLKSLLDAAQGDQLSRVTQCPKVAALDGQEAVVRIAGPQSFVSGLEAAWVNGAVAMLPKKTSVHTGTALALCGKASADRKTVAVRVSYKDVRVEGPDELVPVTTQITPTSEGGPQGAAVPFTQYLQVPRIETTKIEERNLTISSGGHMAIAGPTRVQEERYEYDTPVLSKIPYLSRMYKNVGVRRTTLRTYLIVSPLVVDATRAADIAVDGSR